MTDYASMWPTLPAPEVCAAEPDPYAPTVEMVCDAVHLTIDGTVRIFNVHRLRRAIDLLAGGRGAPAAVTLRREYRALSVSDVTRYLLAAQRCIDYDVTI